MPSQSPSSVIAPNETSSSSRPSSSDSKYEMNYEDDKDKEWQRRTKRQARFANAPKRIWLNNHHTCPNCRANL